VTPGQDNDEQGGRQQGPTATPRWHVRDSENRGDGTTNDNNVDTAPPRLPRATARGVDGGASVWDPSRQGRWGRHMKAIEMSLTSLGPYVSFSFFSIPVFLVLTFLGTYYYGRRRCRGTTTTAASACSQGGRMRVRGRGEREMTTRGGTFFCFASCFYLLIKCFFRI
jgi:hypothetical protein